MSRDKTVSTLVEFLRSLSHALAMAALYDPDHPRVPYL